MTHPSGRVRVRSLLIPPTINIPPLYSQEDTDDPTVHVKLFTPFSSWTWLITEFDATEDMAFGFCYDANYPEGAELGYVSLREISTVMTRWGTPAVERDVHFLPKPLSRAKAIDCPGA